ncbi:MAG: DUF86 domain-containing protein [Candidatus Paceibacteria bacterium]
MTTKLDPTTIENNLEEIEENIEEIKKDVSDLSQQEFLQQNDKLRSVKYLLITTAEAVGNVCLHIAAKKFAKNINEIPEVVKFVGKKEVISEDLSEKLAGMARLRNLLVHQYWEIDDEKIYKYASEDLKDLRQFIEEIREYTEN